MNIKLFLVIKALNVLPTDIIRVIYEEITSWEEKIDVLTKKNTANYIKRAIQRLAFNKFDAVNSAYLKLIEFTNENNNFSEKFVIQTLLAMDNTLNYLYIDDNEAWIRTLNLIRYKYFNMYISQLCSKLITEVRYKKREYKIRIGRFFSDNAILSTNNYLIPWMYRDEIIDILYQNNTRSINEIPGIEFIDVINTFMNL